MALFSLIVPLTIYSLTQSINVDVCTSQEIGWENRFQNDL